MSTKDLHLLVESGPIREKCEEWRDRYVTAMDAAADFARKHGAPGFVPGLNGGILALVAVEPPPPGWQLLNKRARSGERRMAPHKGEAGAAIRAEIDALPRAPSEAELSAYIGHPEILKWRSADGHRHGSTSMSGKRLSPVDIMWTANDDIILLAPDTRAWIDSLQEDEPGAVIERGDWVIPAGLRVITEAEYKLLHAQANVDAERRARRQTDESGAGEDRNARVAQGVSVR